MVKADARYKRDGVCSAWCLDLVKGQAVPEKATQAPAAPAEAVGPVSLQLPVRITSSAELLEPTITNTRTARCQRCWAINHTERLADGELGLKICKNCEASTEHEGSKAQEGV